MPPQPRRSARRDTRLHACSERWERAGTTTRPPAPVDVTCSRGIVDFLEARKLIKKSPELDKALLRGRYERYAR
ncbi:hypothetical protein ACIQ6K_15595 [Streptomyces sp. NPDC096354]|uniref:hypothetical protein n=1 Tax=Streptomyces sp. NPDC096354 TaxID=3366088 RepID=UPI00381C5907